MTDGTQGQGPRTPLEALVVALRQAPRGVRVAFRKVSGETTERVCTLNPALMPPPRERPKGAPPPRMTLPGLLNVYQLDPPGWKCFRHENLIRFSAVDEEAPDGGKPAR